MHSQLDNYQHDVAYHEEVIEESTEDVVGDEGTTEDSKDAKANESDSSDDKPENKQDNKE